MEINIEGIINFVSIHKMWIIPIATILATLMLKQSFKKDSVKLDINSWLDFGADLAVAAVTLILSAGLSISALNVGVYLFFWAMAVFGEGLIIRRIGWEQNRESMNLFGIIISDFIGGVFLAVAVKIVAK